MNPLDWFTPSSVTSKLTDIQLSQVRIEAKLGKQLELLAGVNATLASQQQQFAAINQKLEVLMSKADEIREVGAGIKREVAETKEYVKGIQTQLDAGLKKIEELIAQDAEDAEIRAALDETLPDLRQGVDDLDKIQHPTPPEPPADGEPTETEG